MNLHTLEICSRVVASFKLIDSQIGNCCLSLIIELVDSVLNPFANYEIGNFSSVVEELLISERHISHQAG